MSVICQTFIQNSWKKDLCSNCFKTLADHRQNRDKNRCYLHTATPYRSWHYDDPSERKYVYNSDKSPWNQSWSVPKVSSLLKENRGQNGRTVAFLDQDPIIIGYGGDDYHTDEEDLWDVLSDDGEFNLDKYDETEEDRAISKITKENTRFNTRIKEEVRSATRYEPVYMERRVTRIDDSYAKLNQNGWKFSSDRQNNFDDFSKPYYLPRVSIGSQSSSSSSSNSSYHNGKQSKSEVQPFLKRSTKLEIPEKEVVSRSNSPDRRYQSSPVSERCDSRLSTRSDSASFVAAKLKPCPDEIREDVKSVESRAEPVTPHGSDVEINNSNKNKQINNSDSQDKRDDRTDSVLSETVSTQEKQVSDSMVQQAESGKVDCNQAMEVKSRLEPVTTISKDEEPELNVKSENEVVETNVKDKKSFVHYAVSNAPKEPAVENHYAVSPIFEESQRKTVPVPDRETKLAALAIELEQVRYDQHKNVSPENLYVDESPNKTARYQKQAVELEKQEESQKSKKSKFSLKKLLKRNKDTETTEQNSKAWKHGEYDKSTLRLKIVHPMDLAEALSNSFPAETEAVANDSLQTMKLENEEKTPAQSCKQEIPSTSPQASQPSSASQSSNRGKTSIKSERPSKPPPPPKCNPVRPKSVEFIDLTVPLKNGLPMEISTRNHQEQVYDVPKNLKQQKNAEEKRDTASAEEDKLKMINNPAANDGSPRSRKSTPNMSAPDIPQNGWKNINGFLETSKELHTEKGANQNDKSDNTKKEPNKTSKAWITLEHSYAVVTAANHEVLSKFLDTAAEERSQQLWKPENSSLNWMDFELVSNHPIKILHDKLCFDAIFKHGLRTEVTLMVTKKTLHPVPCGRGESTYPVLGYFVDNIPPEVVTSSVTVESPSTVLILQRSEVDALENYCSSTSTDVDFTIEKTFVLLQLVHFLKVFQGRNLKGVPEIKNIFLSKKDKDMNKVVFLNDSDISHGRKNVSLCQFALTVAKNLFHFNTQDDISSSSYIPSTHKKIFNYILRLLLQEKSFSLMQVHGFIEYALWGPISVVQNCKRNQQEMDITLQRWLDTERAKCLKLLVRTLCTPNVVTFLISYDEFHAEFLLKTSVRSLREVALKS